MSFFNCIFAFEKMMTIMCKRLIYICLLLSVTAFCPLRAQYDFPVKSSSGQMLYYQILGDGESVRVTHPEKEWPYYSDNKPVGKLLVPGEVTYEGRTYRVVEIGANAFYRCDSLTGILSETIQVIGTQAFCGCVSLQEYRFRTLRSIGEGAFAYCRSLVEVVLDGNLEHLGISAFSMCTGLQEVKIHPVVERLCDATTFHGCPLMEKVKNRKKLETGWLFWSEKNN